MSERFWNFFKARNVLDSFMDSPHLKQNLFESNFFAKDRYRCLVKNIVMLAVNLGGEVKGFW